MLLAKAAQAEFEAHFASQTEPQEQSVHSPKTQDESPLSPSNTFHSPVNNVYGNPRAETGVDETYSEAIARFDQQNYPGGKVPGALKDPPEETYPLLMMKAECTQVEENAGTEEQLLVVATLASQGQLIIAEPVTDNANVDGYDQTNVDDDEQIEVAKALSLSEYQADERKPAAVDQQRGESNEITPVKEPTSLNEEQVEKLGADPEQAYTAHTNNSQNDGVVNPLAETDSEDGSKSVSIYCRASNMRDVSNLTFPTGVGHDSGESSSEESATVTMSPRRTRSQRRVSAPEQVQEE
jgi:hypothetical protein